MIGWLFLAFLAGFAAGFVYAAFLVARLMNRGADTGFGRQLVRAGWRK